jgi:hypothetical protein
MASMAQWDSALLRHNLGSPLWHAQETYDPLKTVNPTYELAYWRFGLNIAQQWQTRLGAPRVPRWDTVREQLASLPIRDSLYVGIESSPTTFSDPEQERDHPSMLMAYGFLPQTTVDTAIMRRTLHRVVTTWRWEEKIWGWDYPMMAMTAARLGEPDIAIDLLLKDAPHNHYAVNGHCGGTPELPVYLPANGALLSAVALMTAGWDGSTKPLPGFPHNGQWNIHYENIHPLP